ncbi:MAG: ABC transporter permease subunit, partial [Deltaproteobacteria bacterium]|nr:ABC transporter permease subunit [Deltaproteobacteria bacterium]
MKTIWTIAKREFTAYFTSPIAYVYLTVYLAVTNWFFFRGFFIIGQADVRGLLSITPWIFLFFVPAVAMGKWAEERKLGTLEILFTLPLRHRDIAVGKFLAGQLLIAVALALTLPTALTVSLLGPLDWGPVIGGYVGLLFLGGAYLAIGLFAS